MIGRYEQLVERAPDGIIVHDGERIIDVNAALLRLTGASRPQQLIGRSVSSLLERPYLQHVEERLISTSTDEEPAPVVRNRLLRLDGGVRDVDVRAQLFLEEGVPRAHIVLRDVTARLAADQLQQERAERARADEKLREIRRLAGGVAHEVNNMLQIILGFAGILAEEELKPEQKEDVSQIIRSALRGAKITSQLLQFARHAPYVLQAVQLGEAVPQLVEAMQFGAADGEFQVAVQVTEGAIGQVWVDPGHLRQILENLVANAYRAMKAAGEIDVIVSAVVTTDAQTASDGRRMAPGDYSTVAVRDTGVGMTPELQRHIFDPFFTTSEVGQGTGLGLAAVQGMLALSGGFLTVKSAPAAGSTFTVWFPTDSVPAA